MSEKKVEALVNWLAILIIGLGFVVYYFLAGWVETIDKDYRGTVRTLLAILAFFWPLSFFFISGWIRGLVEKVDD